MATVNTVLIVPVLDLEIHNGKPAVTSQQVAKAFGKEHHHVLRDIREVARKCSDSFNATNFVLVGYTDAKGEKRPMYALSKDGLMIVTMGYTTSEAMRIKEAYIAAFNEMEARIAAPSALPDFGDPVAAARAWADAKEQQQKAVLALEEAQPKVAFVDRYVDTEGLRTLTQVAKTLKVKRAYLIGSLLASRHIFRDKHGKLQPYAQHVKAGLFNIKEGMIENTEHSYAQLYVTPKGVETLSRITL